MFYLVLLAIGTIFLWIVLHEAGHALAGKLFANSRVEGFRIIPFFKTNGTGKRTLWFGECHCRKENDWTLTELIFFTLGPQMLALLVYSIMLPIIILSTYPTSLVLALVTAGAPAQFIILGLQAHEDSDFTYLLEDTEAAETCLTLHRKAVRYGLVIIGYALVISLALVVI